MSANSEYTLIWISPSDIGFFVSVPLFWYWVGRTLDKSQGRDPRTAWPGTVRIAGLTCGFVFGILTGVYADQMIAMPWLPEREIGTVGIAWACALIAYFTWRLTQFGADRKAKWALLAPIVMMLIAAVLWMGGPFGATQALGEYVRPTTARTMALPGQCLANETPPENSMRIVQSQAALYHLSIQKVVVCRNMLNVPQDDPRFEAVLGHENLKRWLALRPDRCIYQFRRHFTVVVADQTGTVVVEAALIQSRWDYLRQNWDKIRRPWFWPYEGMES